LLYILLIINYLQKVIKQCAHAKVIWILIDKIEYDELIIINKYFVNLNNADLNKSNERFD